MRRLFDIDIKDYEAGGSTITNFRVAVFKAQMKLQRLLTRHLILCGMMSWDRGCMYRCPVYYVTGNHEYWLEKSAWLVTFTQFSQNNQHSPLDSANNWCYNIVKDEGRDQEKERKIPELILGKQKV